MAVVLVMVRVVIAVVVVVAERRAVFSAHPRSLPICRLCLQSVSILTSCV